MRLGREVDDRIAALGGARHRVRIGDVALVKIMLDTLQVGAVPGVRQLVEDGDLVAAAARRRANCEPMKPAPPVTSTRIASG